MAAVGIFGGSFDPLHVGHLALARAATRQFALTRLYVVPVFQPPHKATTIASFAHRKAMAEIGFADWPNVMVSDLERERGGVSYTIDSVEYLSGLHPDDQLYLIVGADTAEELVLWREPQRLSALVRLLIAPRPGFPTVPPPGWQARQIMMEETEVSATDLRPMIRDGVSLSGLVSPAVAEYIQKHNLYQAE